MEDYCWKAEIVNQGQFFNYTIFRLFLLNCKLILTRWVDWSGGRLTPSGVAGCETPQVHSAEEAHRPPRRKQVPATKINGQLFKAKKDVQ
ncbi:hypothetical protein AF332_21765 [Sporosarcina globispora]|uniref:Uncharacterized protein n=1 Tax=Sporosarcina globispora TaxID=1459 RepID=A0A0M0GHC4_SPOGL|nr:hypothetical protein AF332_21765 [Sporosarcina globispora]